MNDFGVVVGFVSRRRANGLFVKLELESGTQIDSVVLADLSRIEGEEFAILSIDADTYMQCADQEEGEYLLEYQTGSIDQHFGAVDKPITLDRVMAAFGKYLNNDPSWVDDFKWELLDLS